MLLPQFCAMGRRDARKPHKWMMTTPQHGSIGSGLGKWPFQIRGGRGVDLIPTKPRTSCGWAH